MVSPTTIPFKLFQTANVTSRRLTAGLTLAVNSTTFGKTTQNRVYNLMKLIYRAIFVLSAAISPPLLAEGTATGNYPPPTTNQPAAPSYQPPPAPDQSSGPYYALPSAHVPPQQPLYMPRPFKIDPAFTLLDILIYRPIGLAATLAGVGLVVATSPLIALASIPRPHDAFPQAFDILVNTPAAYTFIRPVGERSLPFPYMRHY